MQSNAIDMDQSGESECVVWDPEWDPEWDTEWDGGYGGEMVRRDCARDSRHLRGMKW